MPIDDIREAGVDFRAASVSSLVAAPLATEVASTRHADAQEATSSPEAVSTAAVATDPEVVATTVVAEVDPEVDHSPCCRTSVHWS